MSEMNDDQYNSQENNIDTRLKAKMLYTTLALKDGLCDSQYSNPEIYLREFLNKSVYFQDKSKGQPYHEPESEAHGECDAVTPSYSIDFKTLMSSSMGQARRMSSLQTIQDSNGVILESVNPKAVPKREYKGAIMLKVLRHYNSADLESRIYARQEPIETVKDIDVFLKILRTKKNLLFFLPCVFSLDDPEESDDLAEITGRALSSDVSHFMPYREQHVVDKETYFSTLAGDDFVIWKYEKNSLKYIESIPTSESATYMKLESFDPGFGF